MDVVKAVETYITKMVSTPNAMKVLLLDTHTVRLLTCHCGMNAETGYAIDTNRIPRVDAIYVAVTSGLPYG